MKEVSDVGFNTAENDPTVLIGEVSCQGSHECNLRKELEAIYLRETRFQDKYYFNNICNSKSGNNMNINLWRKIESW